MDRSLQSIAAQLADLEVRPALDARVLEAAAAPDRGDRYERLSCVLSADPILAARVLRVANSAFFGHQRSVASIAVALAVLGTDAVGAIALASSFDGAFAAEPANRAAFDALRRHSLWTAVIARRLAQAERVGPCSGDEAFIVGLMHDLGSLVHLQLPAGDRHQVLAEVDHALLGAALLHGWHMPEGLVDAVRVHHDADEAVGGREVRTVLWAADALASPPGEVPAVELQDLLGLDEVALQELATGAANDARAIEELVR
jgi:HD-like signal output (HDOD) protein